MTALHVLFKVAEADYVVAASDVLFMESYEGSTRVPGAGPCVAGIVQIRGQVVPVVDLRARFGLPARDRTIDSRVVVVRHAERAVGLLVDSAREVVRIAEDGFRPPPDVTRQDGNRFIKAVAQRGSDLVLLLDISELITQELPHAR